jgi:methylenetetrahydrofolate--tRNA-(uracil-5-)-methyltransferase
LHGGIIEAGQITGCEGYIESAAVGLLAARFWIDELNGNTPSLPPLETSLGALLSHITGGADADTFQPMNVNFGLFPPLPEKSRKADRKQLYTDRARAALAEWLSPQASASSLSEVAG